MAAPSSEIQRAIAQAKLAVELDQKGDFVNAITKYKYALQLIEAEIPKQTDPARIQQLTSYIQAYKSRVKFLEEQKEKDAEQRLSQELERQQLNAEPAVRSPPAAAAAAAAAAVAAAAPSAGFRPPVFMLHFEEARIVGKPPTDKGPSSPLHRPFWLMARLQESMETGGYLTEKLYVPRDLWLQRGAKIQAIQAKMGFCQELKAEILHLEKAAESRERFPEVLEEFKQRVLQMRNALSKALPYIQASAAEEKEKGVMSRIGAAIAKKAVHAKNVILASRIEDDSAYIHALVDTFKQTSCIEAWIWKYEELAKTDAGARKVLDRLEVVAEFYYQVVCKFVMRDLSMLIERYIRRSRESLVFALPP
eukprot:tig00021127_g18795.t1